MFLIANFEDATIESTNALLKLLEEPSPHTWFVLTSRSADALLPTVRSRCTVLHFASATDDAIDELDRTLAQQLDIRKPLDSREWHNQWKKLQLDTSQTTTMLEELAARCAKTDGLSTISTTGTEKDGRPQPAIYVTLKRLPSMQRAALYEQLGDIADVLRSNANISLTLTQWFVAARQALQKYK